MPVPKRSIEESNTNTAKKPIIGDTNREIFPVLISHTKFHWPIGDKSPDEINLLIGGNSPGIIELDYSNWGKIIIK